MDNKQKQILKERIEKVILKELKNGKINEGVLDRLRATAKGEWEGFKGKRVAKKAAKKRMYYPKTKAHEETPDVGLIRLGSTLKSLVNRYKKRLMSFNESFEKNFTKDFNTLYSAYTKEFETTIPEVEELKNVEIKNKVLFKNLLSNFNELESKIESLSGRGEGEKTIQDPTEADGRAEAEEPVSKSKKEIEKDLDEKLIKAGHKNFVDHVNKQEAWTKDRIKKKKEFLSYFLKQSLGGSKTELKAEEKIDEKLRKKGASSVVDYLNKKFKAGEERLKAKKDYLENLKNNEPN